MNMIEIADSILQKLFSKLEFENYCLSDNPKDCEFIVIPGNGAPRWLVPSSAKYGLKVLSDWSPYGISSQIKWFLIMLLYRFNILDNVPGIEKIILGGYPGRQVDKGDKKKNSKIQVIPVIYVGTPGPQQKAVVTLVEAKSKDAVAVMKVAIGKQAKTSIMREAFILKQLTTLGVLNVPSLIAESKESGITLQSVLLGKLSSRCLNKAHLDFLYSLPELGTQTTFLQLKQELLVLFNDFKIVFTLLQQKLINSAIDAISSENCIYFVFTHGDFAPWNIKQIQNNEFQVIDWEDAKSDGLPLWDLCHFTFIQAHLFNEFQLVNKFITAITCEGSLIERYLTKKNIELVDSKQFVLLYILYSVLNKNTSPEYKVFLIEKVLPKFTKG